MIVNSMVQFSIVVPVYCVELFLPQAIESVLSQSVSSWELILVDDGSTDSSGEICDRYASLDKRIRVIHKKNGGLVSARQAGVDQCKGEYVLHLDGDDYWDHDLLLELQTVISHYHPDCISFGFRQVTEDGKPIRELHPRVAEGLYSGESLRKIWNEMLYDPNNPDITLNTGKFYYSIWSAAFRREIVAPFQQLVPKQIKMGEDVAVTIPAVCKCKNVLILDKIKYNYRIRRNSISRTFSASEIKETMLLTAHLKQYAEHLPSQNLDGYLYRMVINYWIKAAKNFPNYHEFKAFVSESLQVIPDDAARKMSKFRLRIKHRLCLFVVNHGWWYLFWLFYHRN